MNNTITLAAPLMVNGKEETTLAYDTDSITVGQFCESERYRFVAAGSRPVITTCEFDNGLHIYLGFMAIINKNPHIDIKDLERIKGPDVLKIARIGRSFTLAGVKENSAPAASDDTSEIMQEPTTPPQKPCTNID